MAELQAGVARANITPPVGIGLVGFAGRGPSESVHDDLLGTALALESGGVRAVIITADLLGFGRELAAEIRAEVEQRTGALAGSVLLCASHTHYGPATGGYESGVTPPDSAAYQADLKFKLAGAAQQAFTQLQPVHLGFAAGESHIGINRRERRPNGEIVLGQNPGGPCDREVRVVRLDTADGRPIAALVNFACHPVTGSHMTRAISADYIFSMRHLVESSTGSTCLFLQGAAGNINPVEMRHSPEPARRLGVMLGGETAKLFESIATSPDEGLSARSQVVELPAMTFETIGEGETAVSGLRAEVDRLRARGDSGGSVWWAESRLEKAERQLESLRTGTALPTIPADITALRFGEAAVVTAPGEIFTETGMAVKEQSPVPWTCFAGYTNGVIGYVPVPEAYAEGGYEVTHACRVAPAAAGMIQQAALELLHRVCQ